jgi:predicted deacylase
MPSLLPRSAPSLAHPFAAYPPADALLAAFRVACLSAGGRESTVGTSVEGRSLVRFDLGADGKPTILLTALMHGVEVVGSLALLDVVRRLGDKEDPDAGRLLSNARLVIVPIVNPDALYANMAKLSRGERAWQRCNANGVDLNRNFPRLTTNRLYHPFSGSRFRVSPHYLGAHSLSEPESRAVRATAVETRPVLSLAFHSFGNLILYPWAYTHTENPRAGEYRRLAGLMTNALCRFSYRVKQARQLYSVLGDMDDWLDAELGTLAFTIEVGRPDWRLRQLTNPFAWMNPLVPRDTVKNLTPGVLALISAALEPCSQGGEERRPFHLPFAPLDFAAK